MKYDYDVIICGAGPAGLMCAAHLFPYKVNYLLIDKKPRPTTESRAVVVQARSMEIYQQMNLDTYILGNSAKATGLCFFKSGKKVSEASLSDFGRGLSPFSYVSMFEQSKNEALLADYLDNHSQYISWQTEIADYQQQEEGYMVTLKMPDGSLKTVTTKYLVACDGAKSFIREHSGVKFTGGTYSHLFYVLDTHVKAGLCESKLNFFTSEEMFHLFFPLEGSSRYRVIGMLPEAFTDPQHIESEVIQAQIEQDIKTELGFYDTQWHSVYRVHHRKVEQFRHGNIFFCGDAAHVHSPVGGQGMNVGLQDAYNLAWKLGFVITGMARPALLDTYHRERNPVAESLLKTTDRMFTTIAGRSFAGNLLRNYVFPAVVPVVLRLKFFRRLFFRTISEINVAYKQSALSVGKARYIKAGMRLPYFTIQAAGKEMSTFELVRDTRTAPLMLLVYGNTQPIPEISKHACITLIEKNEFNAAQVRRAGLPRSFIILLRPDNYIGYISRNINPAAIAAYLANNVGMTGD